MTDQLSMNKGHLLNVPKINCSNEDGSESSDMIFQKFYRSFKKVNKEFEAKNTDQLYVCSPTDALLLYYWISPATRDELDDQTNRTLDLVISKICTAVKWGTEQLKERLKYHRQRLVTKDIKLLTEDVQSMSSLEKGALYYWLRIALTCSNLSEDSKDDKAEKVTVTPRPLKSTTVGVLPNIVKKPVSNDIALPPDDDDSDY